MNYCDKCGQTNDADYQFCRNCGNRLTFAARQNTESYQPPRPYAWKTDEYQTQAEPRPNYPPHAPVGGQMMQQSQMHFMAGNYRCPHCGSPAQPVIERWISPTGWVVFGLLLFFTIVFFWIGLLLKEEVRVCPNCGKRVG